MTMKGAPAFLFAHGAGAPSGSPWMRAWRDRLATLGETVAFDYPYMRAGRKTPDRMPVLLAAHREALTALRARAGSGLPRRQVHGRESRLPPGRGRR